MKYRLGVDIGATKIAYGVFDEAGVIVYRHQTATDANANPEQFEGTIVRDVGGIMGAMGLAQEDVKGMALGFPSYVDFARGRVVFTSNMVNLRQFDARDAFKKHFPSMEIIIDNDTNLAAIAEHAYGAGRGFDHMLYTAVSTGIGSGFIINGQIYRGAYGGAGESGHMIVTPETGGVLCGCDNEGCFMSYAAGSMVARHARQAIAAGEKSILSEMVEEPEQITAVHINEACHQGDALALRMRDQIGYYLGIYIYNFFIGVNLNCYVLGGGMLKFGAPLLDKIQATFDQFNHQKDQVVYIKQAELKQDVGIIGAAELLK